MTDQMPKDMVVALREVMKGFTGPTAGWPMWFTDMEKQGPWKGWTTILSTAADDLERMQKLNGKLYKTLYPD